jgi:hypothetical protein
MRVNKAKFRLEIFEKRFKGNYNQCAKALGVETPQLHRFLKLENSQAGALLLGGLYSFCDILESAVSVVLCIVFTLTQVGTYF